MPANLWVNMRCNWSRRHGGSLFKQSTVRTLQWVRYTLLFIIVVYFVGFRPDRHHMRGVPSVFSVTSMLSEITDWYLILVSGPFFFYLWSVVKQYVVTVWAVCLISVLELHWSVLFFFNYLLKLGCAEKFPGLYFYLLKKILKETRFCWQGIQPAYFSRGLDHVEKLHVANISEPCLYYVVNQELSPLDHRVFSADRYVSTHSLTAVDCPQFCSWNSYSTWAKAEKRKRVLSP